MPPIQLTSQTTRVSQSSIPVLAPTSSSQTDWTRSVPPLEANTLYKEGTGYPTLTPFSIDYSFYRDNCGKGRLDNNLWCVPHWWKPEGYEQQRRRLRVRRYQWYVSRRGPAPWRTRTREPQLPIERNASFAVNLPDICVAAASPPNRVRDFTSDPANNSTFGTLDIRRTVVNNTGGNVTRLRFRVIDLTTFPAPSGIADLRPRTSTSVVVTVDRPPCGSGTSNVTVQGTTLEQPPSQPNGGGFNSSMSAGV